MSWRPPIRAELFRLFRVRTTWYLLASPALVALIYLWLGAASADREAARVALSGGAAAALPESGFGPMADGLRSGGVVLTLVLLVLGALGLARERESGALGSWFMGRSRHAVVVAKAIALLAATGVGFGLLFVACYTYARWQYGLGPIVDEGYELATVEDLWREIRLGTWPAIPGIAAAPLFGLFVSSMVSSTGVAVAATLVPFVLGDVLKELLGDSGRYLFVTYAPFLGAGSPLAKLPDMARFYADQQWRAGELWRATWVPTVWGVALVILAILITRRRAA